VQQAAATTGAECLGLAPGDAVVHTRFGQGVVVETEARGGLPRHHRFAEHGVKRFLLALSQIERAPAGGLPTVGRVHVCGAGYRGDRTGDSEAQTLLRGWFHEVGAIAMLWSARSSASRRTDKPEVCTAIACFAVTAMLTTSALYHRISWSPKARRRMRRATTP